MNTEELIDSLALMEFLLQEEEKTVRFRPRFLRSVAGIAAGFALLTSIGIAWQQRTPKDTFTDPAAAYAQVEMAFGKIGDGLRKGSGAVDKSNEIMQKQMDILESVIK